MASALSPYVTFPGTAREALTFYRSVFGGEVSITTFGEFGSATGIDPEAVMHGQLSTPDGYVLMASDPPPGTGITVGDNITLALFGDDAETLRGYFAALAEGGEVTTPLEQQVWGDEYGSLKDRYGVNWLANIAGAPA